MRQTLLRIKLDQLWLFQTEEQILYVGVGFLLIPWVLFGLESAVRHRNELSLTREHLPTLLFWLIPAAAILAVPWSPAKSLENGIPVYGYGFMLFVGFVVAGTVASRRARQVGLNGDLVWDLGMWFFFSGVAGARLFYICQYPERVFGGKEGIDLLIAAVNLPDGGLVFYGGILSVVAFFVFCRVKKLNLLLMGDIVMPSIFIGLGFGRIGCFFNGCCYGDVCHLPWAATFPQGSVPFLALVNRGYLSADALGSLPLHPTQIYSSLNGFLLAALTGIYFRYRHRDGAVLAMGMLLYPVTRFMIEVLRFDEPGRLTISQWVSIGLFCCGMVFTIWLTWNAKRGTPSASLPNVEMAS